jgi:hypothetical protein
MRKRGKIKQFATGFFFIQNTKLLIISLKTFSSFIVLKRKFNFPLKIIFNRKVVKAPFEVSFLSFFLFS